MSHSAVSHIFIFSHFNAIYNLQRFLFNDFKYIRQIKRYIERFTAGIDIWSSSSNYEMN